MIPFKRSIRKKLILMIMSVTCIAVILTTIALSWLGISDMRNSLIEEIEHAAHTVGEQSKHHMRFGYQPQVMQQLEMLRLIPSVQRACLYDAIGNIYAVYPIPTDNTVDPSSSFLGTPAGFRAASQCPLLSGEITHINGNCVETHKFLNIDDKKIGSIYIRADITRVDNYITRQLITTLFVLMLVATIAFILAIRMQRTVSHPVLELARAASRVSMYHDYSYVVLSGLSPPELIHTYSEEIASLVVAFNKMLHDVKQREQALNQQYHALEEAKNQAESANIAKSQFLASISHELRTPLNAIIGFTSIMKEQIMGELPEQYRGYNEDNYQSAVDLLDIINDILDLSCAETGALQLALSAFDVQHTMDQTLKILSTKIAQSHAEIELELVPNLPPLIADRVRFIQIMINIISNAMKFSRPETTKPIIRIKAMHRTNGHDQKNFHFYVYDQGIGMDVEEIERAFQSFKQIDSDLNRKYAGTGLGLPLTKRLVDMHGGSILIESIRNKGTCVHIVLPQGVLS